ncbi:MAG TPA: DMT family transporter [Thermoanaerobaculia bacterium]|nr:DMT family transporter [Thermoanaerobaculia bacterium]
MTRDESLRVHGALLITAVLFSGNFIVSKMAMAVFAPMTFAWLRVFGAALLLNAITGRVRLERDDRRRVTRFAILGVVINQTLFLGGLSLTSAHVAAILITTIPVFALGVAIVHRLERATAHKIGGIGLACLGALLVIGGEQFEGSARSVVGAVMIVANCLAYATYLVLARPLLQRIAPTVVIARMFAAGTVLMLPIAAWSLLREEWSAIPPSAWLSLLLVILGPTVGAYLLNAWALRYAESSLVAAYIYVQPVLTTILAAIYLGEQLHWLVAVAGGLIFIGVAIAGRAPGPIAE